jgi:hypothetical protein
MDDLSKANQELAFDDVEMEVPGSAGDYETIPAGMYPAALVGFRVVDKPDWKVLQEQQQKDGEGNTKVVDPQQWEWTFEITEGEYAGVRLTDWTNRSLHERATAHKHTAALLGVPSLEPTVTVKMKLLKGKACQLWVVEKATKKDPNTLRNFIERVAPVPAPRQRTNGRQGAQAAQRPTGAGPHTSGSVEIFSEDDITWTN